MRLNQFFIASLEEVHSYLFGEPYVFMSMGSFCFSFMLKVTVINLLRMISNTAAFFSEVALCFISNSN